MWDSHKFGTSRKKQIKEDCDIALMAKASKWHKRNNLQENVSLNIKLSDLNLFELKNKMSALFSFIELIWFE